MQQKLRPSSIPLAVVDPFFSIWSNSDHVTDDWTRFWTGARQDVTGLVKIDGKTFKFLGRYKKFMPQSFFLDDPCSIEQTDLVVNPTQTIITFANNLITLTVTFTTPLLLDKPEILSMPITYIDYKVESADSAPHKVDVYFDFSSEICCVWEDQKLCWDKKLIDTNLEMMRIGTIDQPVLEKTGDGIGIDWGYLCVINNTNNNFKSSMTGTEQKKVFVETGSLASDDGIDKYRGTRDNTPILSFAKSYEITDTQSINDSFILAYNDISSVEYFGKHLKAFWTTKYASFEDMILFANTNKETIVNDCVTFNNQLLKCALNSGGEKYRDICALAYRQSIAAHKLVHDEKDGMLFFSKECHSNGCIGTVDVSYPSIPLFLLYNPDFVKGMIEPIFTYANSGAWPYTYAPHDMGVYPKANGQVYGLEDGVLQEHAQMPVEECGNMLIMAGLICMFEKTPSYAQKHWGLLTQWVDYLVKMGIFLDKQLCTDDFAGHLEKNTNLAIKGITGVAFYAHLCKMQGDDEGYNKYYSIAKQYALEWEKNAVVDDHTMLAFGMPDSFSLKYNLIWDVMLGFGLFSQDIAKNEVSYYIKKMNKYGTPLDSRAHYTKTDWLVWAACLDDSHQNFESLIAPIWDFVNETPTRVPFSDWYSTIDRCSQMFQNRSVLGGIYIKILKDKVLSNDLL